ncbi:zinc-finger homeodomain protein 11-like [Punica granatum]|uniref:ZF-HD dimerization-type domain-containing protein n=2 Tax=Punica granatum TaxID=22663 RepID=A0A218WTH0_PUNGR|nr:zinc-finger homeodomain protein 11-like [Punica granatum]OWM75943.1 hypothetical protein CDL15_Pgr009588 [Punica granatum]PKI36828.1 hypothetical protein CRG98_042777 [Punica granatum]
MDSPHNKAEIKCPATTDHSSILHLGLHQAVPEPPQPAAMSGYRECRKNHAARLGRLALDGCREFMPSTSTSAGMTNVPGFLICAACGCHRNFHRRDYWASPGLAQGPSSPRPLSPVPTSYYAPAPWMLQAPGSSRVPEPVTMISSPDGDEEDDRRSSRMEERKKRGRTKFSKEQKEKMEAFAEKAGWKMKSSCEDDDGDENNKAVEEFCREVGVSRGVLKIWMNNHKRRKASS